MLKLKSATLGYFCSAVMAAISLPVMAQYPSTASKSMSKRPLSEIMKIELSSSSADGSSSNEVFFVDERVYVNSGGSILTRVQSPGAGSLAGCDDGPSNPSPPPGPGGGAGNAPPTLPSVPVFSPPPPPPSATAIYDSMPVVVFVDYAYGSDGSLWYQRTTYQRNVRQQADGTWVASAWENPIIVQGLGEMVNADCEWSTS